MASMVNRSRLVLAVAVIMIVVASLGLTSLAVTPKEATQDDIAAEAKAGGYSLINTGDLKQRLEKDPSSILLVDTRQEWEYAAGHMKGAVNFPMEPTRWSRWWKRGDLKNALGPGKDRFIVFY